MKPHKIADLQIGRTLQNIRLWSDMTVLDNICIAQHSRLGFGLKDVFLKTKKYKEREAQIHKEAWELLEKFSLADKALDYPKNLPYGIQRRVEIARALSLNPKLLMLDEPSMGLAPILVEQIFEIIQDMNRAGTTILLVEQNAQMALSVANRAYVMETGRITTSGTGEELLASEAIQEAYLGKSSAR